MAKTRMAAKKERYYGGYDREFVDDVPDRFICQICTRVLRDPHLAVCCGQHFCESCLSKWFTRQGKESCPHCRAEGEALNHVINKGLRSEINQLKICCSNHGEGCEWTGELGELESHLESDNGCGYADVPCPNKCSRKTTSGRRTNRMDSKVGWWGRNRDRAIFTMKRKDLNEHLTNECYLRPCQCEFCDRKGTYEEIMGPDDDGGHQARCPEAPLTCPNECGANSIKRKDMKSHRSQCPQERVECPFTEAGCKENLMRCQFEEHINCNQQQHLLLVMKDHHKTKKMLYEANKELSETKKELSETKKELSETKKELSETKKLASNAEYWHSKIGDEVLEVKGSLTTAVQLLRRGTEADKETVGFVIACSSRLIEFGDSIEVVMPKFTEYRHSGKVWCSPPFYYREGYKMCLEVHANGVGKGAGTHVSVSILLLGTPTVWEHIRYVGVCKGAPELRLGDVDGHRLFKVCFCEPIHVLAQILKLNCRDQFCSLESGNLPLVNGNLKLHVSYVERCYLLVHM